MDPLFEALLKEAVRANFNAKMDALPPEEELLRNFPPSAEHTRKMKAIFAYERRTDALRKLRRFAKTAAILLCIVTTLFFAALMFNPNVRAAIRNAIVEIFDGYTRFAFTEQEVPSKAPGEYSLTYIPQGYTLESTEDFGKDHLAVYTNVHGDMLIFNVGPPGVYAVDNEYLTHSSETYGETTYDVFMSVDNTRFSTVAWAQDGYLFTLKGTLSKEELLRTAMSVE
jgi:hypothetical protein